ncbi:MAG: DNA polymerase IV [Bacteroidales bacterium]|nr:DNA polymerase IV [Bacteroidales bacterium]
MQNNLPIKKIIHVDMDAFYASVEQMDNSELIGKPVAVGGGGERGVVAAASYEARTFGVRSAMPGAIAKRKCPHLIFVKPRFERYKELSQQIRNIFYDYSELVEPLSLDEAFIDVTENKKNISSASRIAREIRERIFNEVGLRASAGISINKFTAKIASDINKPNGQKTILPEEVIPFLEELNIEKFFGIGKVTAEKMNGLGIFKGKDLKEQSIEFLVRNFGKSGKHFYEIVRGIQHSEVRPNRLRKSIAAERTFTTDISSEELLLEKLEWIAEELERRMKRAQVKGKTITVKIKHNDFTIQSRSKTLEEFMDDKERIFTIVQELIQQEKIEKPVRLLGISINKLDNDLPIDHNGIQLRLTFPMYS